MLGTKMFLVATTALMIGASAQAEIDWDEAQRKMFPVDFVTCTHDRHPARVHLALTAYAPLDFPPPGFTQATKEELAAVASVTFPSNFTPFILIATDAAAAADGFIGEIAMEPIVVPDENGKPVRTSVIMAAMNETKAELMKSGKYSGMGISYEASTVTVDLQGTCGK